MKATGNDHDFLSTPSAKHWEKIGVHKRAGVAVPLFSLYSEKSLGIGEFPDLRLLADWCKACGMSIIQLLPLNDVGFNFMPYDAQSMFALDPMYLSLRDLAEVDGRAFQDRLAELSAQFPTGAPRVNYGIKRAKLDLLWSIFSSRSWEAVAPFDEYVRQNSFWLLDYALFKILKQQFQERHWQEWEGDYRRKDSPAALTFAQSHALEIQFQQWLQWQCAAQFKAVKAYVDKNGTWIMGDLPFLVSRDSADVWANQEYFKLDLAAGAPPDAYQAKGQRWGMPPYHWEAIARNNYDYLANKLNYAQNFYDLYRIDHFVGTFRLWTIPLSEPAESGGLQGSFDPRDEHVWEDHGRQLLTVMLNHSSMLPCAEDLGVVPPCSYKVLEEFGVPGMEIQRWCRDWGRTYNFKTPESYRPNAMATISTHDMSILRGWWETEAGTVDEWLFQHKCEGRGLNGWDLKSRLFDPLRSKHGRLYWKQDIHSVDVLLHHLGRRAEEAADFIDMYRGSYDEQAKFWSFLGLPGHWDDHFTVELALAALKAANRSSAVFSIQLLPDWLSIDESFHRLDACDFRINCPGSVSEKNWSLVMPFSLEHMLTLPENLMIRDLNNKTGRI